MAEVVKMPKLSDTMTEGVVAKWHKKIGDQVKEGDLLAEIETDKATMEYESFQEGILLHQGVSEGKAAAVDTVLAILGKKGENFDSLLKEAQASVAKAVPAQNDVKESVSETKIEQSAVSKEVNKSKEPSQTSIPAPKINSEPAANGTDGRLKASPLAKKLAEEKGLSLRMIRGTGEGGRITKKDIEEFVPGNSGLNSMSEKFIDSDISQMRKTIARRLTESKFSAPHFYLSISLDMDQAIAARTAINNSIEGKISFNDMVVKAAAMALMKHPEVNVSWMGDKIRKYGHAHIGVAVAVEEGLLVPVIRHANAKSFQQIGTEVKFLAEKAKNKTLQPEEWEGSTFTISNLGMFGIEEFTAIINPPNSCILAVGGIEQKPVVKNGQIVPGNVMKVTLSCDHRVVDGAKGSEFLKSFRQFIENPITMFV